MDRYKLPSRQPSLPNSSMGQRLPPTDSFQLRPHTRECPRCRELVECLFPWVSEHRVLRRLSPDSPLEMLPCLEVIPEVRNRLEVLEAVYSPLQEWRRMV